MEHKRIESTQIFAEYQDEKHDTFYVRTKKEFIEMVWQMVQMHREGPIGMGNWNQTGAKEYFFDRGYMEYLKRNGLVDFVGEDWYIIQWDREASLEHDDRVFYITRMRDINMRHARYIKQLLD